MLKKFAAAASNAVLGSVVDRDYAIGKPIASGGPMYLWRLHECTKRYVGEI